ncbi:MULTISPECIES: hypothetical protein [unclassified Pseudomonas]|uniref:hypothetical protein n=1 Tax=unclassified Pseudomonas TaxID=196821 RepID=UPI002AC936F2|nr:MULTISPECIES: hypothetical protein [unclassified Pseudomonas]MEB0165770.1 hypothetical protein [Pseudomonas sp. CCC4.4]WPX28270.1 hypothetical protein RHM64_00945 [Pseudomonas sp. AH2]
MRADGVLRLFAVPFCGALVYAAFMPLLKGFNFTSLFSGFLFGFIVSMFVGIPLLLLGDKVFPGYRVRHILSSLFQSLLIYLVYGGFTLHLLVVAIAGGLVLGGLYTALAMRIEQHVAKQNEPQRGRGYILGIPLCGGLSLVAAAWGFFSGTEFVAFFVLFFFVGAGLSMLISWPVLWLIEGFLTTPFRYVVGGILSGFLIWLLCGAPAGSSALFGQESLGFWPFPSMVGMFYFVSVGLVSGLLFTGFNWIYEKFSGSE